MNYRVDLARNGDVFDSGMLRPIGSVASGASSKPDVANMVRIPAGKVNLGNSEAVLRQHGADVGFNQVELNDFLTFSLSRPSTTVELPAFWIDPYEVTNKEYAKFVQATGRTPPKHWAGARVPPVVFEDHPVVWVSHDDALAYAAWSKKKLPTDAQWLRAFRGDSLDLHPWGNKWESNRANVGENAALKPTSRVTATPLDKSRFGVFNMVGNAEEMLRELEEWNGVRSVVVRGGNWKLPGAIHGNAAFPFFYGGRLEVNELTGFRCVFEEP